MDSRRVKQCLRRLFRVTLELRLLSSHSSKSVCACYFLKTEGCSGSWNYNTDFCPRGHVQRSWNQFHINWWILVINNFWLTLNINPKIDFTYWELLLETKMYPLRPKIYINFKAILQAICNNSRLHFHQEVTQ